MTLFLTFLVFFVVLNVLAYRFAYYLTHFVPAAEHSVPHSYWQRIGGVLRGNLLPRAKNIIDPAAVTLPFETLKIDGRRGKLEAWYIPHDDPAGVVLFFHGYGGCKAEHLPEAKALFALGYSGFLVDFPGSGGSDGDATTIGYHESEDVAKCVAYVRERCPDRKIILYGVSMGAVAVLRALAVQQVEVDRVILECPFDRLITAVGMRMRILGVPLYPLAHLLVFWGGVQNDFNGAAHNPVEYARAVRCPVLLMQGDKDDRVLLLHAQEIYANLAGKKTLHIFQGMGHEEYLAKQPKEWHETVEAFLKE